MAFFGQGIPVEHGGDPRTNGSTAADFDDVPAGEDRNSWQAKTQPGSSESRCPPFVSPVHPAVPPR